MNQTILQPPYKFAHYGQACRTRYNTKSSYEAPLHYHHFVVFPELTASPRPSNLIDPVPFIQ